MSISKNTKKTYIQLARPLSTPNFESTRTTFVSLRDCKTVLYMLCICNRK
jgi:hypothetical protein